MLPSWLPRFLTNEKFRPKPISNYALAGRHMILYSRKIDLCSDMYSRRIFSLFFSSFALPFFFLPFAFLLPGSKWIFIFLIFLTRLPFLE